MGACLNTSENKSYDVVSTFNELGTTQHKKTDNEKILEIFSIDDTFDSCSIKKILSNIKTIGDMSSFNNMDIIYDNQSIQHHILLNFITKLSYIITANCLAVNDYIYHKRQNKLKYDVYFEDCKENTNPAVTTIYQPVMIQANDQYAIYNGLYVEGSSIGIKNKYEHIRKWYHVSDLQAICQTLSESVTSQQYIRTLTRIFVKTQQDRDKGNIFAVSTEPCENRLEWEYLYKHFPSHSLFNLIYIDNMFHNHLTKKELQCEYAEREYQFFSINKIRGAMQHPQNYNKDLNNIFHIHNQTALIIGYYREAKTSFIIISIYRLILRYSCDLQLFKATDLVSINATHPKTTVCYEDNGLIQNAIEMVKKHAEDVVKRKNNDCLQDMIDQSYKMDSNVKFIYFDIEHVITFNHKLAIKLDDVWREANINNDQQTTVKLLNYCWFVMYVVLHEDDGGFFAHIKTFNGAPHLIDQTFELPLWLNTEGYSVLIKELKDENALFLRMSRVSEIMMDLMNLIIDNKYKKLQKYKHLGNLERLCVAVEKHKKCDIIEYAEKINIAEKDTLKNYISYRGHREPCTERYDHFQ